MLKLLNIYFITPGPLCPLHTIPLIITAEDFVVINGFYSYETGKCSQSFDSLRIAYIIDLEAFPEQYSLGWSQTVKHLKFNPLLYLVTLLCSWKGPEWEQIGWWLKYGFVSFSLLSDSFPNYFTPCANIQQIVLSMTWSTRISLHCSFITWKL